MSVFLPGIGVLGLDGGPAGFNPAPAVFRLTSGCFPTIACPLRGNWEVSFFPGFETTSDTNPSVRFNRLAAWKIFRQS